ncbi:MAG: type II secretion system protein [Lentisphaeria bacterium]|nr:type II secretion system protein [Lentisphaeria bacterium]
MKRSNFTLTELLVVIAIIALLAGITLPALGGAREKAKGSKCASNLKQCITAYISYSGDYKGWGPAALADSSRAWGGTAASGKKSWGSILVWKGYLTREVLSCPGMPESGDSFNAIYGIHSGFGKISKRYLNYSGSNNGYENEIAFETLGTIPVVSGETEVKSTGSNANFLMCSTNWKTQKNDGARVMNAYIDATDSSDYIGAVPHSGQTGVAFMDGHAELLEPATLTDGKQTLLKVTDLWDVRKNAKYSVK